MNTTTSKAEEMLKLMTNPPALTGTVENSKIEKAAASMPEKIDRGKFNKGGAGGGRPPSVVKQMMNGVKQWKDKWYHEMVELSVRDPKTGAMVKRKMPRYAWLYEKVFNMAVKDDGNIAAVKEIIDRNEGKAMQPIGNAFDEPFKLQVDMRHILTKSGYDEE